MNAAIAWFARNHVAANLLMLLMLVGGLLATFAIKMEVFPEVRPPLVTVTVEYPGAAPEEVEEGINIRIEEEIEGLESVERITSTAAEGIGIVAVELLHGENVQEALDDIKTRVDAIDTFPEEAEKPVIRDSVYRQPVINVAVSGEVGERTLKVLGERVRDELAQLPGVTQVELASARPYEISIEISETALRRHGLSFDDVARAVRASSADIPGGSIETPGGEILLRTKGQAYRGPEFERLPLITRADGTRVTIGDVARVIDGFEDTDQAAVFDGEPSVLVQVFRVGDQSALDIARIVKGYVAGAQEGMPEGVRLTSWSDESKVLRDRLNTLLRNGAQGAALVFAVLSIFLRLRLAFWVILGVPLSFLGALWLMPALDLSINVVSLFAFIVVLGILVDDAIVVGESIYTQQSQHGRGRSRLEAAVRGAQRVATPVVFGVLTTVTAFVPLVILPGNMGQVFAVMGLAAILCLLFSLAESLLVLPAHLGHGRRRPAAGSSGGAAELEPERGSARERDSHLGYAGGGGAGAGAEDEEREGHAPSGRPGRGRNALTRRFSAFQDRFAQGLERFIDERYRPALARVLEWRYLMLAAAVALLLLALSLPASRRLPFSFFPPVEADNVVALLTMPLGTPAERTRDAIERLETAARELRAQIDAEERTGRDSIIQHAMTSIGEQPYREESRTGPPGADRAASVGGHLGEVNLALAPGEDREISAPEIAQRWRELAGPIADAEELVFASEYFSAGDPINVQLQGPSLEDLRAASERLKQRLAGYPGVFDIADSWRRGKREVKLDIKPSAEALGLTLADLGRQVRQAFYGDEAQRIQRGRHEVKVMVRYPEDERTALGDLERMRIRAPGGREVPFAEVAEAEVGRGYATVRRADRQRIINVTADVDLSQANANEVLANLGSAFLPRLLGDYPGMTYTLEGEQREQREALGGLVRGYLLALFVIYALLAVPLRSYVQPLIIMSVIPFGFIGVVTGHVIMGHQLSIMSVIGAVAMSGVVVNASLVLVHYMNTNRRRGVPLAEAVRDAAASRFRPIVLTSLTTFAGLTPLMLERSLQAQFLIPMAISLAYGVLFATAITLLVVPSAYLMLDDLKRLPARLAGGAAPAPEREEREPARERDTGGERPAHAPAGGS